MRKKKIRTPTANKRSNPMPPMPSSSLYSSHSLSHSLPSPRPFIASHYKKVYFFISIFALSVTTFFLSSISSNIFPTIRSLPKPAQLYTIQVVNEFPHDPHAFTQGLLYGGNDTLFESTGLYHQSSVRRVVIQTGKIVALQQMDSSYFGEGLTLYNERLYQVTWLKNTGFMYDRNNLSKFEKFTHEMKDGWGLATDGRVLFGTDGSSTLYHIDPQSLKVLQKQVVKYKGREVFNLNELEYVNDEVWANVWQTDCIAIISPEDGVVREWILLHNLRDGLFASGEKNFDVLNGIAWDKEKDRIFVTGKLWPKLYEIKLQPTRNQLYGAIEDICMPMPFIFPKA